MRPPADTGLVRRCVFDATTWSALQGKPAGGGYRTSLGGASQTRVVGLSGVKRGQPGSPVAAKDVHAVRMCSDSAAHSVGGGEPTRRAAGRVAVVPKTNGTSTPWAAPRVGPCQAKSQVGMGPAVVVGRLLLQPDCLRHDRKVDVRRGRRTLTPELLVGETADELHVLARTLPIVRLAGRPAYVTAYAVGAQRHGSAEAGLLTGGPTFRVLAADGTELARWGR
ncbi:hypothetical protein [Streptomyces sp. NPDC005799]|uniref:hypothetical protein n=1 Tax=Streptomyces sp. NPDC005799 TaxID=3154678 RepID=UPI0033E49C4E